MRMGKAHEQDIVEEGILLWLTLSLFLNRGEIRKFTNTTKLSGKRDILMVLSDVPKW